jgi:hypothetical protein
MTKIIRKNNITIKNFKNLENKPNPLKKGITFSIEQANILNKSNQKGHIFKKYVNGNLVKQVFVKDKQIKGLIKKVKSKINKMKNKTMKNKTMKKGGVTKNNETRPHQPTKPIKVIVENKTNIGNAIVEGAAFGFGWAVIEELLFDNN